MSPNYKQGKASRSRRVMVAVAIIGAAALAVLASHSVSGLASQAPIPSAKATIIARAHNAGSSIPPADKTKTPPFANSNPPVATPPTGIFVTHQGPFANSSFAPVNVYVGQYKGQPITVYAGTKWTNYETHQGQGALLVFTTNAHLLGEFVAPDNSTWLQIESVQGDSLLLKSDKSATLTFSLATMSFT